MIAIRQALPANVCRRFKPAACVLVALAAASLTSGCGSIAARMANNLSVAILSQDDPELIREALPAYLVLIDSFIASDPDSAAMLSTGAQLYSAYGSALVSDPKRARTLTNRAHDYGVRALCSADKRTCNLDGVDFDTYVATIQAVDEDDIKALYSYSLSSLAWIRANSDDYKALAALPKIEVALNHVMTLNPGELAPATCMYLGILNTLRPAALGGDPEAGRVWFEQGIALTDGKDLSIKVEYARGYARLLYNRELHDQLLNDVMAAEVEQPNLTLINMLARDQAEALLASADDYF